MPVRQMAHLHHVAVKGIGGLRSGDEEFAFGRLDKAVAGSGELKYATRVSLGRATCL